MATCDRSAPADSSVASTKSLFLAAAEIDDLERRAEFLDQACRDDADMRRQVDELLAAADSPIAKRLDRGIPADDPHTADTDRALTRGDSAPLIDALDGVDLSSERIGPYRLLERIGEGGMGSVYMAEQTEPIRRKVALKLIKPGMDSRHVIARFEAERQALALMDHPNIAQVLDAGTTDRGLPYFVMELVRGQPITQFCAERSLSLEESLRLFINVCRGVQHAHQKGIIHRDLKPSNVMVTLHDGTPVVKIIDFGVAKALHQSLTERTLFTHFAQAVGTPLYMSPEQAALSGLDVDTRSDVYALGVLLFELLTGTTPVDRELARRVGMDEVRRMIRETDPPPPSRRVSTLRAADDVTTPQTLPTTPIRPHAAVRGELDWITLKALEKDRHRRYQSASDLADDVQRHLEHQPVEAGPASAWYRGRKLARRYRAALTTAAAVVLALLLGTTASTWQAVRATRAVQSEQQQRREAEQQRRRAERQQALAEANLHDALAAVDRMLVQVSEEQLNDIPMIQPIRRELMGAAADIYERFVQRHPEDEQVRLKAVRSLQLLGQLHTDLLEESEAERRLRRAVEILGPIDIEGEYSKEKLTEMLSLAHKLAFALKYQNDMDGHGEWLRKAVDVARDLFELDPSERHRKLLGEHLASYASHRVNHGQSERDYLAVIEYASEAVALDRSSDNLRALGLATMQLNQLDEARRYLLEAASIENDFWLQKHLGQLATIAGRRDEAAMHYREAFQLNCEKLRETPGNRPAVNSWHQTAAHTLDLLESLNQTDEVQDFSHEVLDFADALLGDSLAHLLPQDVVDALRSTEKSVYLNWLEPKAAESRLRTRLESQASDELEQVLALLLIREHRHSEAFELLPDDHARIDDVDVLTALAERQLQDGDTDTAIACYLRAMDMLEPAIRAYCASPDTKWNSGLLLPWSKAAKKVRQLLADAGRSDEYHDTKLRISSFLDELTSLSPSPGSKAGLMRSLGDLYSGDIFADVFSHEERFRKAIHAYMFIDGQGHIHKRIGWCHFHLGEYEQAIAHFRKTFELTPKDSSVINWGDAESVVDCDSDCFVGELLELGERLTETNPDCPEAGVRLGHLLTRVGVRSRNRDEFVEAEEFARRAADQFAAMAAGNPAFIPGSWVDGSLRTGIRRTYPLLADLIAENSETAGARDDEIDAVMSQWAEIDRESSLAIRSWADYYAKTDRWPDVIRVLDLAIATLGEEHPVLPRYWRALAELAAGDEQRYRETCRELLAVDADAPGDLDFVAWTCVLHPAALDDWEPLPAFVESLEAKAADDPVLLKTIAAAHYRAGQIDEAIGRFLQSLRLEQAGRSSPAYGAYFLAMAHQRGGRDDEARCWLDEANRWADLEWADDLDGTEPLAWNRRLTLNLLRDEATLLLAADDRAVASQDDSRLTPRFVD